MAHTKVQKFRTIKRAEQCKFKIKKQREIKIAHIFCECIYLLTIYRRTKCLANYFLFDNVFN